ncbi:unnamed protein product, partial [Brassica rapa subsp. trilocularis]
AFERRRLLLSKSLILSINHSQAKAASIFLLVLPFLTRDSIIMSDAKEEKAQVAADRIKAAALTAAKGLSRTQAERAATAAARNVNAYGQKEEGPSRWQEKREAKRQMYFMSTEKAVRLGERKDNKSVSASAVVGGGGSQCQEVFSDGALDL